jgi:hypothetical protein
MIVDSLQLGLIGVPAAHVLYTPEILFVLVCDYFMLLLGGFSS